jgi:hypothetical protein
MCQLVNMYFYRPGHAARMSCLKTGNKPRKKNTCFICFNGVFSIFLKSNTKLSALLFWIRAAPRFGMPLQPAGSPIRLCVIAASRGFGHYADSSNENCADGFTRSKKNSILGAWARRPRSQECSFCWDRRRWHARQAKRSPETSFWKGEYSPYICTRPRLEAVDLACPAQWGERLNVGVGVGIGIGIGIGIELINAGSIFPHAKSIPITTPIVQIFTSADIHPWSGKPEVYVLNERRLVARTPKELDLGRLSGKHMIEFQ